MSTPKARRADRHYRCARCGLERTYPNATAASARHWFDKHSCRKREDQLLRSTQHAARRALVDRTPKPCLHKRAHHQHGERATYVLDKCRCEPCSKANVEAENWRERQKAYGRYNKYVPAEFVRDHLRELAEYGIGTKTVSKLSGVSNGSLTKIIYGAYAPSVGPHRGCKGNGDLLRGPARRVLRKTAEAIYAVEAIPANLPGNRPDLERTPLARLHLRALVALGWSMSRLGRRVGILPGNFSRIITGNAPMNRDTVDKVEALFAELSMQLPPETDQRERIAASRSRKYAKQHGWLPPLALPDVGTDEFDEAPDFDEAAIYRRMHGDKTVRLTKAELAELVRRWWVSGRPLNEMERLTGVHSTRYVTKEEKVQAS